MSSIFGNSPAPTGGYLQGRLVADIPERLPAALRGKRRRITTHGESVLHKECAEVTEFGTPELKQLIDDMFATMEVASGVGLAANQVGVDLKVFVFDCDDADDVRHVGHICNPVMDEVLREESDIEETTEGCLSVPGPYAELDRPFAARVSGVDYKGNPIEFEGLGMLARCFQHETDHLNGLLYVDHLTEDERERCLAEMDEMKDDVFDAWDKKAAILGTAPRDADDN